MALLFKVKFLVSLSPFLLEPVDSSPIWGYFEYTVPIRLIFVIDRIISLILIDSQMVGNDLKEKF